MFSWDIQKAILNFEKHGVSFEEAATAFDDDMGLDWEDIEHSEVEPRRKRLAMSEIDRLLLIVYTNREFENGKETIRIISARRASRRERRAYFG
ncbi:MAG TPA: BrnT family toxin [Pyrinomonadaceae bacterium]|nr:BrnT family toxin [Pyrinomonadaceae bacterium]